MIVRSIPKTRDSCEVDSNMIPSHAEITILLTDLPVADPNSPNRVASKWSGILGIYATTICRSHGPQCGGSCFGPLCKKARQKAVSGNEVRVFVLGGLFVSR